MAATALVLAVAVGGFVPPTAAVEHFPGAYFNSRVREPLQRQVMTSWPGPTELVRLWRETELSDRQRIAILIGGAVFHDPEMLPLYRDAMIAESQILRLAAIYGYRDFTADGLPNDGVEIDARTQDAYEREMRLMDRTLRRHTLLEVWLQSALQHEGASLPGYAGIILRRSSDHCLRAAEKLVDVHDLNLLVVAYQLSTNNATKIGLLQLIEAITLNRFIAFPSGNAKGWGMHVYNDAHRGLETQLQVWQRKSCSVDERAVIRRSLRREGVKVADPFAPEAWRVWLAILRKGPPRWWPLAARRLYACGGPWYELSIFHPDSKENRARRDRLSSWYRSFQTDAPANRR
jgi:hypothetical protein